MQGSKSFLGIGLSLALAALASGRASAQITANLTPEELEQARANAAAQETGAPRTYGGSLISLVLPWAQFVPFDTDTGNNMDVTIPGYRRFCPSAGPCAFEAPVFLPNGASVVGVQMEVCDSDSSENVVGVFFRSQVFGGSIDIPAGGLFSTTGFLGCQLVTSTLGTPLSVDNLNNSYFFEINLSSLGGPSMSLRGARLFYQLQVSPAPATASFPVDVPTSHPYFRFIEALAAAGITAGCAPQSYCPNAPITRGEMAVFLSAALGLHFPN